MLKANLALHKHNRLSFLLLVGGLQMESWPWKPEAYAACMQNPVIFHWLEFYAHWLPVGKVSADILGLCRMDTKISASTLEIIHYTVDLDEASCGVSLSLQNLSFSNSVLLNVSSPGPLLAGYTQYSIKR